MNLLPKPSTASALWGLIPTGRSMLTVIEVSAILSCSKQHVLDLIEEGRIPAVNIGTDQRRAPRVPVEGLKVFLTENGL